MSSKIRWGILSTANIGLKHVIPAIDASSNGEVVAIASRNRDRAKNAADQHAIPEFHASYEALLNDPNVDAIYNPLPNSLHAQWSIAAAEAGKPMLCEKPLAVNAEEAEAMVEAFRERGIPFAEAFMYRFHPQTQRVLELIDNEAIGEVNLLNASFTFALRNDNNIRLSETLAGGSLMDVGCYCVNVMRLITGEEPDEAGAIAVFGEEVDEWMTAMLGFPSGVLGHFDCGLRSHRAHRYEIKGTDGRIVVEEGFTMPTDRETAIDLYQGDHYEQIVIPPANSYKLMVEDFADALLNDRPPQFDAEDAAFNMAIIDALLASAGVGSEDDE